MLKKAVTATILPVTRQCKCGSTVPLIPTDEKTYCNKCGESIHAETKISSRDEESELTNSE